MALWEAPWTCSPSETSITDEIYFKILYKVSENHPRVYSQMKKHIFEKKILKFDKNIESLWHQSHDPLPPQHLNSVGWKLHLGKFWPIRLGSFFFQLSIKSYNITWGKASPQPFSSSGVKFLVSAAARRKKVLSYLRHNLLYVKPIPNCQSFHHQKNLGTSCKWNITC